MRKISYLSLLLFVLACEAPKSIPKKISSDEAGKSERVKQDVEDEALIYLEELPVLPESPQPIVVMMHGYGANERDVLGLGKALSDRFFVVSVRAPIELGDDRYAWFGRGQSAKDSVVAANAEKVIEAIQGLPRTANAQSSGDDDTLEGPLVVAGFSQGGRMAIEVARRARPGLIQGAIAFSPARFKVEKLDIPVLISHGRADKVVPFSAIEPEADALIRGGSPLTFEAFDGRHTIPSSVLSSAKRWTAALLQK